MTLLEAQNLKTYFFTTKGPVKAVDGVSFTVGKAEALGLAGESGCGKTTAALSILRLLQPPGKTIEGKVIFEGENLLEKSEEEMQAIRWKRISIIFQGAMNALNPVFKIGEQIAEGIKVHENVSENTTERRAEKLLELVGLDKSRFNNYPHELSGGMRQRAMIAMALACNPDLVIADEPATALDVIMQAQVLKLMKDLQKRLKLSMLLITHDLSMIAETCDRTAVMYAGKIAEYASSVPLFKNPLHPYTMGLLKAFPDVRKKMMTLTAIRGDPPDLLNPPSGCKFHPRCQYAISLCKKVEPELLEWRKHHYAACHLVEKIQRGLA